MEDYVSKDQQQPSQDQSDSSEEFKDTEPLVIFDGNKPHTHEWEFVFKDGEGRYNYKCKHCIFGRASNERLS